MNNFNDGDDQMSNDQLFQEREDVLTGVLEKLQKTKNVRLLLPSNLLYLFYSVFIFV